jgi:hypothetical protein
MATFAVYPRPGENDNAPLGWPAAPPSSAPCSPVRPSAWSRANLNPETTAAIALSMSQSLRNRPGDTSKMRDT